MLNKHRVFRVNFEGVSAKNLLLFSTVADIDSRICLVKGLWNRSVVKCLVPDVWALSSPGKSCVYKSPAD